jgi:adenylylsulfate kinase
MENIYVHDHTITTEQRNKTYGHKSPVLWFTGLSGSGKSTVGNALESILFERGIKTYILDGDNVRSGLNSDLGFTDEDRIENIRRISHLSQLFSDSGTVSIASFISPFIAERESAKEIIGQENFIEVHFSTPLDVCESRDPKKLYERARQGIIKNFTGIDSVYEPPVNPEITIDTTAMDVEECAMTIIKYLEENNIL